ncbi:MAG: nucleotidyl transferase AbiEii/AbiGii toxin family protein [Bradyrhizobium sp.]|nr:nucleotidyl transferase AbiEii/AbiGii toxin family protein [Bradyrhizobium sp.]
MNGAEAERELREVQAYFRLPSVGLVEKDMHVVRAIAAIAQIDAAPFTLVFGGGTALARAHKLVSRMSEDVDFKIVPLPAAAVSRTMLRQQLGALRARVTSALQAAGFVFDPTDTATTRSRNESRYTIWQLPYDSAIGSGEGLRPTIQVELTYAPLRLPSVPKPVSSFISEAFNRPPEVAAIPCVSLTETAAEKLISLTRRTAMERAGLSRDPDPTLVRHIYDLHAMHQHIDRTQFIDLARAIAIADGQEFRNQYPAYAADIAGETQAAVMALQTDPAFRQRYDDFVLAMVYGDRHGFGFALGTVTELTNAVF